MDFSKIISRAWEITKRYRFLWWLGIIAAFAEGGNGYNSGSSVFKDISKYQNPSTTPTNVQQTSQLLNHLPRVLGASTQKASYSEIFSRISGWMSQYWPYLVVIIGGMILLYLLIMYLANSARAGLISSVDQIESGKDKHTFGSAFHKGIPHTWRLLGLDWYIGLIIFAFFILIAIPLTLALVTKAGTVAYIVTGIFSFLGIIVFIALAIYLSIIEKFAARVLVLQNVRITEAFLRARKLFHNQRKNMLLTWLINLGIGIVFSIALGFALAIIIALLVGLGVIFYMIGHNIALGIYAVIMGIALIAAIIVVGGIYTAFSSSFWTLSYRAVDYLEKKSRA